MSTSFYVSVCTIILREAAKGYFFRDQRGVRVQQRMQRSHSSSVKSGKSAKTTALHRVPKGYTYYFVTLR